MHELRLSRDFNRTRDRTFDVAIVGGGITGVAIAREAAARGLDVCLVEKNDFGWFTSSATSKLLHGGLRYLEHYEFGLVRESIAERRRVGNASSHLVRELGIRIPVYRGQKVGRFQLKLGFLIYDALAWDRNKGVAEDLRLPRHNWLSAGRLSQMVPAVPSANLRGAFTYYEYQSVHPERLTLDWALTAVRAGALLFNHTRLERFEMGKEPDGSRRIDAAIVKDLESGSEHTLRARVFVNASGPWMEEVLGLAGNQPGHRLSKSTGIHFVTRPLFNHDHGLLFYTKDGGTFFVIPWQGHSLIGLTDAPYEGSPDDVVPRQFEVEQIYSYVNETLPGRPLRPDMIRNIIVGIRPLVFSGEKTTRAASRKFEIYDHGHEHHSAEEGIRGFVSVAGGKWTTSRRLGHDVVEELLHKSELAGRRTNIRPSDRRYPVVGSCGYGESARDYLAYAREQARSRKHPVDEDVLKQLVQSYGTRHTEILDRIDQDPDLAAPIEAANEGLAPHEVLAQIDQAIEAESAQSLDDIVRRRLLLGTVGRPTDETLARIASHAARLTGWDEKRREREIEQVVEFYRRALEPLKHLRD
ncbi:MAG: glycerol-3-phosphate dehydrogenase/oxidase [Spirochaetales bacterium]|nr:glycerol-3-phosphate dehydrogenase/oxidase [Leptospiraceae bacterium]MCP5481962.1 glycerol-3-phosphate dehydrogenase/oxidase [Spirochaetales bacterium]